MRVRRILHGLLVGVLIALGWQIVMAWSRPLPAPLPSPPDSPKNPPSLQGSADPAPGEIEQLAAVVADKNLFDPRRGQPVEDGTNKPAAVSLPPPTHLKLVGILLSRERAEAFFADSSQGGKVVRVQQGDTIGAYRLARVSPGEAFLASAAETDGEETSLPLLILGSGDATRVPHMIPTASPSVGAAGRPGLARTMSAPSPAPPPVDTVGVQQEEAQALRENIQQMQHRLRQLRRQAARRQAQVDTGEEEEGGEGEGGEEDE